GIRDKLVTGVQTCAPSDLTPIAEKRRMSMDLHEMRLANGTDMKRTDIEGTNRQIYSCLKRGPKAKGERSFDPLARCPDRTPNLRSEERRVGKECRTWSWER